MADLPTGTVIFLFADIEGSTTLAQQFPADLPNLLARHHALLYDAAWDAAYAEGRAMTMEQAIAYALSEEGEA